MPTRFLVRVLVAAMTIGTFVGALVVAHELFPDRSGNNDEAVYVYQAQLLRQGDLTMPVGPETDFVRPWMSGTHDGDLVMVFQPVFPAVLAASDLLFGSMRVAVALLAAACIPLAYRLTSVLLDDERAGVVAALLFATSPLVIVHSGLYLEYLFAVGLEMGVLLLVVTATGDRARARTAGVLPDGRRLAAAGLVHGVLLFARPLEALVLAVVVLVHLGLVLRRFDGVARAVLPVVVGAAPIVLSMLAYNTAITGNPLPLPLWATGGDNAFGFGTLRIAAGSPPTDFRLHDAWFSLRVNLRAFPHWFAGGLVSVAVGGWGAVRLWRDGRRRVLATLAALGVLIPFSYFFYWGNLLIATRGRLTYGPHYYLALLIPAVVLTAAGAVDLARRGRHLGIGVLAVLLLVGTGVEVGDKLDANRHVRDRIAEELAAVERTVEADAGDTGTGAGGGAGPGAVVVVPASVDGPYLMHPRGAMANPPSLDGPLLYAVDLQARNNELPERFPGRTLYRLQRVDDGHGTRPDVVRIIRRTERGYRARISLTNLTGQPTVVLYAGAVGSDVARCVLDRTSTIGRTYTTSALVLGGRVVLRGCEGGEVSVALPPSGYTLALGVAYGPTPDPDTAIAEEQRLWLLPRPAPADTSRDEGQHGAQLDLMTPPDTWRRGPGGPFRVTVPDDELRITYDAA